ncbi:hypothetical protein E4U17_001155 [Claviceps sp. LM77 group G4]|nr:hypothetical protein E4U17_001155 [Claviceps sp. LM77 group G4]KAG6078455.1 hypothetical protein E4U33_000721 [Claviceps sp. LM78 group G4]KAG6078726.1 hypothetical protein E4U16_001492 [Claviceps sp. LM84 group G4]
MYDVRARCEAFSVLTADNEHHFGRERHAARVHRMDGQREKRGRGDCEEDENTRSERRVAEDLQSMSMNQTATLQFENQPLEDETRTLRSQRTPTAATESGQHERRSAKLPDPAQLNDAADPIYESWKGAISDKLSIIPDWFATEMARVTENLKEQFYKRLPQDFQSHLFGDYRDKGVTLAQLADAAAEYEHISSWTRARAKTENGRAPGTT